MLPRDPINPLRFSKSVSEHLDDSSASTLESAWKSHNTMHFTDELCKLPEQVTYVSQAVCSSIILTVLV